MMRVAGYDIGGAHLKVAVAEGGRITAVRQIACPLWRGVDQLNAVLVEALSMTAGAEAHRVTMTGELADVFPDRFTGVSRIVERVAETVSPRSRFWMGRRGFGTASEAVAHFEDVASTNFLATVTLVGRRLPGSGLLVDMGSTTTDIVAFSAGRASPMGVTDAERLVSGELVYTGFTRTPVMAVTTRGVFGGNWQSLARDPFAAMADVHRILGTLPDGVDLHRTADGRGTSDEECLSRLARCFGRDFEPGEEMQWRLSARQIAEEQLRSVIDGCLQVLSARTDCDQLMVSAGIGAAVVAEAARRLGAGHVRFAEVAGVGSAQAEWSNCCAPAVAMALLGDEPVE